ncbi:hypothetical protein ABW19_dt0203652 [Dactylella cylindrospora]|nr:hypothetical protein ABW19_dt0203652 [Dactylella cylindrospora]
MVDKKKPQPLTVPSASATEPDGHISIAQTSDRVTLSLRSGATATILLYGATIISWKINSKELLWLSTASSLDGSKPVRGGIPLVFPVFGPPPAGTPVEKLAQHGFARSSRWELMGRSEESDESVRVDFGLSSEGLDDETKAKWPYTFGLLYSVTLTKETLETKMVVQNPGEETFDFNILFHTYLRIPDITKLTVSGLSGLTYRDKTQNHAEITESSDAIAITSQTDRVYVSAPGSVIVSSDGAPLFTVTKEGLNDVVLWNPYEDGVEKIEDWEPKEGYKEMVCVEAGSVAGWQSLEGGAAWEGGVVHKAHL